ncbi:hypothetical protein DID77_00415 [Candidatus Marinamargulisbacteria bacterium SCGC AG-439-L15]|nr:hypothetical protein DID77_00415 [Candidatus Marinamargulisbacteria bacterium SCGC AG-439-L15]
MNDLLLDIGNSSVVSCLWDGSSILESRKQAHHDLEKIVAYYALKYNRVFVSSVVPSLDEAVKRAFSNTFFVDYRNVPKLAVNLVAPEQVGSDRLLGALAAHHLTKKPTLVVDSGTALTFCYTTGDGCYEGGLLFPGMKIASKSLNDYTAKIPLIEVAPKQDIVGKTTRDAVEAGLYYGYIALINGVISQYREKEPGLYVIGTGGGLDVLRDQLDLDDFEPDLVMKGLGLCASFLT